MGWLEARDIFFLLLKHLFPTFRPTMSIRTKILESIDAFRWRHRMSERRFGLTAVADPRFLPRLRSGAGVTLTVIERAEIYMAEEDRALMARAVEAAQSREDAA